MWAAVLHEVLRLLCEQRSWLRQHQLVAALLTETRNDWVEWKTAIAMREVDEQITELHRQWNAEQTAAAVVSEAAPDGSNAQQLLGGELRIQAPWTIERP